MAAIKLACPTLPICTTRKQDPLLTPGGHTAISTPKYLSSPKQLLKSTRLFVCYQNSAIFSSLTFYFLYSPFASPLPTNSFSVSFLSYLLLSSLFSPFCLSLILFCHFFPSYAALSRIFSFLFLLFHSPVLFSALST